MIDFEKIKNRLLRGEELENILKDFGWMDFEDFVSEIFSLNDFDVKKRVKFKTDKKYEIDIVAEKRNFVVCVDCKRWKRGRYKKSALKIAAKKQIERCEEFKNFSKNKRFYVPLIVTLYEEDILKFNSVFFVPVWKLNNFLNKFESLVEES